MNMVQIEMSDEQRAVLHEARRILEEFECTYDGTPRDKAAATAINALDVVTDGAWEIGEREVLLPMKQWPLRPQRKSLKRRVTALRDIAEMAESEDQRSTRKSMLVTLADIASVARGSL